MDERNRRKRFDDVAFSTAFIKNFMEQEAWLSGNLEGMPTMLMPAAHALIQAAKDIEQAAQTLTIEEMWMKPHNAPSVAFHLRHIAGSIDRLLTYTGGKQLNSRQFDELAAESKVDSRFDPQKIIESAVNQIEIAVDFLRRVDTEKLFETRFVGRKNLPANVFGLLFHIAEHTQRHTGQIITTTKVVKQYSQKNNRQTEKK